MTILPLINAHRPKRFDQVIGQNEIIGSLQKALKDKTSHAFCFAGPSGTGKTTLARLAAQFLGSNGSNVLDFDAATFSGIDDMRSITQTLAYRPLGKGSIKSIIVDEAHAISAAAWKSLLKSVEEPPPWVYWFFCTTELTKVPANIKTRCSVYTLKNVPLNDITDFLDGICEVEQFDTPRSILELCSRRAEGSPRNALSNLAVCYAAKDRKEAAILLDQYQEGEEKKGSGYDLAMALAQGYGWDKVRAILEGLAEQGEHPEGVRHVVRSFFTTVVMKAKDEKAACAGLKVLDAFGDPFNPQDGMTPLVIAVGRSMF